ncbi:MAG: hypothetical protein J6M59_12365 [Bacteroidaceae bacterium]|uniref:hypothetical protein n=1 Tax=unclassified Bacteroides TaxID=2646097 RepID=UPI0004E1BE02|nr:MULTISPECIES: hypothetical protein [unclassified Bacteroides]MBP3245874.1 hypothetical protein [Bacteroidaceae bacterium]SDG23643.1 hypothetical protein SAMN05216518_12331 [Bacteroidales bacterium KHT7]MBQ3874081.1 hypothetical protein [Bacteroidaceae bacterium]MBQ4460821.1 hypothetical protein [Bacteroidaceae bacterium]MCR4700383.1 hypothetical protein [Bacteroidaceae bacterium]
MKCMALWALAASFMSAPAVAQESKMVEQDSVQAVACVWEKGGIAFTSVEPVQIRKNTPQLYEVSAEDYMVSLQMIDRDGLEPDQMKETMQMIAASIGIKDASGIDEIKNLPEIKGHIVEGDLGNNGVYLITLAPENSTVAYLMIIVYVEGMEEDIDRIIDSIRKVDK